MPGARMTEEMMREVRALTDEYRTRCLWFLREDFYPETEEQALMILRYIAQHGDVAAFQKVAPIRRWLLQNSSAKSVS